MAFGTVQMRRASSQIGSEPIKLLLLVPLLRIMMTAKLFLCTPSFSCLY